MQRFRTHKPVRGWVIVAPDVNSRLTPGPVGRRFSLRQLSSVFFAAWPALRPHRAARCARFARPRPPAVASVDLDEVEDEAAGDRNRLRAKFHGHTVADADGQARFRAPSSVWVFASNGNTRYRIARNRQKAVAPVSSSFTKAPKRAMPEDAAG